MAVWDSWDSVKDFRADCESERRARESLTLGRLVMWLLGLAVVLAGLVAWGDSARAANYDVVVTCDGASGRAAPFIVTVEANGVSVDQTDVTGRPVPEQGGEPWSWSLSWHIEGEATIELVDWTHIDWSTGKGTVRNVHDVYHLDCPVPTTTNAPTTTEQATTTTDYMAKVPVLEVDPTVPQSPETTVQLSTVSPSTTTFEGMDGFYVLSETETSTTQPPVLAATGAQYVPQLLGAGAGALMVGCVLARIVARPRRRVQV